MINDKLVLMVDMALAEVDNVISQFTYYRSDEEPIKSVREVLFLLKKEVQTGPENINKRVLRAMHDLGIASYREFANTTLEKALDSVIEILYNEVPIYRELTPLGRDFGKGEPI